MAGLYTAVAGLLSERCFGGLHAGLILKGCHLQWRIRPYLRNAVHAVLDGGCGESAPLAMLLARRYPTHRFEAWNLYLDQPELAVSCERLSLGNLILKEADLLTLNATQAFDLIFSIDVLEHIADYEEVVRRFAQALRPGGALLLHVPSRHASDHDAGGYDWSRYRPNRPGDDHVRHGFELEELKKTIEACGLSVARTRWTIGPAAAALMSCYRWAERRGIPGIGITLALPMTLLAIREIVLPLRRGEGLWLEAIKAQAARR
jgi:SAM-dependent methyltransferase